MKISVELTARKAARAIARGRKKGVESPRALGLLVAMAIAPRKGY